MKFRLKDGSVVEAEKDCGCGHHEGPHWVRMDDFWKKKNRELMETRTWLGLQGSVKEEIARLANKEIEMESRGIAEIIRESDEVQLPG
jgi:hypothetical protein